MPVGFSHQFAHLGAYSPYLAARAGSPSRTDTLKGGPVVLHNALLSWIPAWIVGAQQCRDRAGKSITRGAQRQRPPVGISTHCSPWSSERCSFSGNIGSFHQIKPRQGCSAQRGSNALSFRDTDPNISHAQPRHRTGIQVNPPVEIVSAGTARTSRFDRTSASVPLETRLVKVTQIT